MQEIPSAKSNDELAGILKCAKVDVVDFSSTPTGTHKYFKAERAFEATRRRPIVLSSGNYAKAIRHVAQELRRSAVVVLDSRAADDLESEFVEVVKMEDLEDAVKNAVGSQKIWPNRYTCNRDFSGHGLSVAYNLYKGRDPYAPYTNDTVNLTNLEDIEGEELSNRRPFTPPGATHRPSYNIRSGYYDKIFCPVGSGELLYDIVYNNRFISHEYSQNYGIVPVGHPAITGNLFDQNVQTSIADKLVTPTFPLWRELERLKLIREKIVLSFKEAKEDELSEAHELSGQLGFDLEVSGSASMVSLIESFRKRCGIQIRQKDKVLILATGKGKS